MSARERAIRQLMAAAGIRSTAELARRAERSRLCIRQAMRGETTPTPETVDCLAAALRLPPAILATILEVSR